MQTPFSQESAVHGEARLLPSHPGEACDEAREHARPTGFLATEQCRKEQDASLESPVADALPDPRYERKFVISNARLPEVLALVHRHPALFREVYPPRAINNIYLDTPALTDYRAHVNGAANRLKTRIRWYGPLQGHAARPALEEKLKRGVVGGKRVHPLPPLHVNGGVSRPGLNAWLDQAALPAVLRARLRHLEPTLVNRYQRRYFESADRRFRLTVDSDLEFHAPADDPGRHLERPGSRNPDIILELKFVPEHAPAAERIANTFPFRLTRCSKYVMGIERLHPFL